jgi:hypothetical protein
MKADREQRKKTDGLMGRWEERKVGFNLITCHLIFRVLISKPLSGDQSHGARPPVRRCHRRVAERWMGGQHDVVAGGATGGGGGRWG